MARRVVTEDDLGDGEAAETIVYAIDGNFYEIDLSEKNARNLREVLAKFTKASRPVASKEALKRWNGGGAGGEVDTQAVRSWAARNGIQVSDRGRIPEDVMQKYYAAQR